jgi:hypothetical protein
MRIRTLIISLLAVFAISAIASASASAGPTCVPNLGGTFKCEWEVQECKAVTGGIFTNGTCEVVGAGGFGETGTRGKLAAGKKRLVTSKIKSGTTFVLKASGIEVKCKSATDEGTITGSSPGTDETTVTFDTCTTSIPGCLVKSATQKAGNILVKNIGTKLVEGETMAGVKVLAEEFFKAGEFVTLEFGKKEVGEPPTSTLTEKCSGTIPLIAKVTGKVFAIVTSEGAGGKTITLTFPAGGLKTPVNALKVFGLAAELVGEEEVSLVGGGELKAV